MSLVPKISKREWLKQFKSVTDKEVAERLLEAVKIVGANEFEKSMYYLFLRHFREAGDSAIAVYPEREIRKYRGVPNRFFKEKRTRVKGKTRLRAEGAPPAPYHSSRGDRFEVGSEGHMASLIGQLARVANGKVLPSPSPNLIRKSKVRHLVILTDFIGSGDRICTMLTSLWRVRSVRSWWSYGWVKFHILAYSGTDAGVSRIEQHSFQPEVVCAILPPPSIEAELFGADAEAARILCRQYNPDEEQYALGYGDSEVLLGFAHGCPNNMPAIFWSNKGEWSPIFLGRTTFLATAQSQTNDATRELAKTFDRLGLQAIRNSKSFSRLPLQTKRLLLLLSVIKAGARSTGERADRAGLSIPEVYELAALAKHHKLIGEEERLTDFGASVLAALVRPEGKSPTLDAAQTPYYYPKQLRVP